jgi:hypothetical protein
MARWHVLAVVVAILALGTRAGAQPAGDVRRFDGTWTVVLRCGPAPDGALGYSLAFDATVRDGHLHGQYGNPGQSPSVTYDGTIHPDGSAIIGADGLTGDPLRNVGQISKGQHYAYHVPAQFSATHGSGKRTEIRPCDVDFARQ